VISIKFCSLSSGSSGNCQYIEHNKTKILIDSGLSGKAVENLLKKIDVDANDLDAIFVTHEHIDHISGVGVLSRRYDLPVFANHDTWNAMESEIKSISEKNRREFDICDKFYFKDLFVIPVPTFHDAVNPNGYVFLSENEKFSVITDTGWINTEMKELIKDSNLYYIESNHDIDMLKNGIYPWALKKRIISTRGHLSNDNCSDVLKELVRGNGEAVLLAHLSKENNTPELAYENAKKLFSDMGLDLEKNDVKLEVAPRYDTSCFYDFGGLK
jgi:phosphoribosyl 1,2-cyclic phosphodiesterase